MKPVFRNIINKLHKFVKQFCYNHIVFFPIYRATILPYMINRFIKKGMMTELPGPITWQEDYDRALSLKEGQTLIDKRRDIVACFLLYHISPTEYGLFNFSKKSHKERKLFLSDYERLHGCAKIMTWNPFFELRDKYKFYGIAKKFFRRELILVNSDTLLEDFESFCKKNPTFFAKPLSSSYGAGTGIYNSSDWIIISDALSFFKKKGEYILEELIIQDSEMSIWNESSVNTIRIPSFRSEEGYTILQPFLRTGRKGMIVDNGASGGIFATINVKTGIIDSDGADEKGFTYKKHPDSGVVYKGWQVPRWNELMIIVKEIHASLPHYHKYVGFDFALTEVGWVLIEGNWGQLLGQIAKQEGVKYEFERLLGLTYSTYE